VVVGTVVSIEVLGILVESLVWSMMRYSFVDFVRVNYGMMHVMSCEHHFRSCLVEVVSLVIGRLELVVVHQIVRAFVVVVVVVV